jgi:hypothetical protein
MYTWAKELVCFILGPFPHTLSMFNLILFKILLFWVNYVTKFNHRCSEFYFEKTPPPPKSGEISTDVICGKKYENGEENKGKCERNNKKIGKKQGETDIRTVK